MSLARATPKNRIMKRRDVSALICRHVNASSPLHHPVISALIGA
jgi:hypothetical protein